MKVLFGTDGSKYAEEAGKFLAKLPHDRKLQLTVMNVFEPVEIHGSHEIVTWMAEHSRDAHEAGEKACKRICDMFEGANTETSIKVTEGHAGRELVEEGQAGDYDLIVMGAQGHSLIHRMLLGSVSDFVATHAPCSVFIVRPGSMDADKSFKICVAYDHSAPAQHAVRELKEFGWSPKTHIDIVSVLGTVQTDMTQPVYIDMEPVRQALTENAKKAQAELAPISQDVTTHVLDANHTGYKLVDFATQTGANMMVLGSTGSGLLTRFLLGSVSRYILRHAECSVWITRDKTAKDER